MWSSIMDGMKADFEGGINVAGKYAAGYPFRSRLNLRWCRGSYRRKPNSNSVTGSGGTEAVLLRQTRQIPKVALNTS
jgi:hypothetical protein